MLGRGVTERTQIVVAPPVPASAPSPAPEPTWSGVLGRADLIALAAAAADAAAAGRDPGPEMAEANGRRFELRLPFGCDGPSGKESNAAMRWRYDAKDQMLRIHVDPVTWTSRDWWAGDAVPSVETIEGFWITRPWTSSQDCPVRNDQPPALGAGALTLPGQTLALGQAFFADGGRAGRRNGEPYETAIRVSKDEFDASAGFRLRISGRLSRNLDSGPVRCRKPAGPEHRPICLVGVVMDEVAIENPASEETLATWSLGRSDTPET